MNITSHMYTVLYLFHWWAYFKTVPLLLARSTPIRQAQKENTTKERKKIFLLIFEV